MIVARATFLRERLLQAANAGNQVTAAAQARLEQWRSAVEPEGTDWFEKRLRWDGIDPTNAAAALADNESQATDRLPTWAVALRDISERAHGLARGTVAALNPSPLDAEVQLPFEHLLLPAVGVARSMVCSRLGLAEDRLRFPLLGLVSEGAYRMLERGLLRQLCAVARETLLREFRTYRPFGRSLCAMLGLPDVESAGDTHYWGFVNAHLESGYTSLYRDCPVLGRLLATAVELWADTTAELLQRLVADSEQLGESFGLTEDPPQVSGFATSLGDRHRSGRSVVIVEFACGRRVVYKPKPLAMEAELNRLLEWCNRRGSDLKVTTVVDQGEYGWVEYVAHLPCADEPAAERFFRRAGMLLCLLHVLRATDCHYENLIAHGDHPVLIDAETLLYPELRPLGRLPGPDPDETVRDRLLGATVLRTGLLPRWQCDGDRLPAHDNSGLGGLDSHPVMRETARWRRINTDDMEILHERRAIEPGNNVARIGTRTLSPLDYEPALSEGFEFMYRLLMSHRQALCGADGPLAEMRGHPVRFIFRRTSLYGAIVAASWGAESLAGGVEYGVHLEQLARPFLAAPERPATWPVFDAEVRAMELMDMPLFTARTDSTDIYLEDGTALREVFTKPSHDTMLDLVSEMHDADLERQILVIQAALKAKTAHAPDGRTAGDVADMSASAPLPPGELVEAATKIGLEIERHALTDGKDAVNWIGMNYLEGADRYQLDVLNESLYDGCTGVALFLAALATITGEQRFADLSLRSLHSLRRGLRYTDPASRRVAARLRGIGGATGLGSVIYGLVRTSGLLGVGDNAGLLEDASRLSEWLTPEVISDDERLDVVSGAAGALLGLLALHSATGQQRALGTAVECGEHLLRHRVEARGHRVWRTVGNRPLTGFSHGAAGIAYALARLYSTTGERTYLDAALEGIEYERALFSERHGNWADLRPFGAGHGDRLPVKWCHGAAGIALARLGCRHYAQIQGLERDIEAGLRSTREHYLQDADFLCCGNLGRAETFLVAGRFTADPEWQRLAAAGTASVIARAADSGGYRLFTRADSYNPVFFHGTAGIGYQLLRLATEELPSVLLWE